MFFQKVYKERSAGVKILLSLLQILSCSLHFKPLCRVVGCTCYALLCFRQFAGVEKPKRMIEMAVASKKNKAGTWKTSPALSKNIFNND